MSCQHLVCAVCAGPVAEGRCPTCRTARSEWHSHLSPAQFTELIVIVLAVLAGLSIIAVRGF
jgi:hypothetical protein